MKKLYLVRTIILAGSLLLQLSSFVHFRVRRAGLWAALLALAALAITNQPARAAVVEAWAQRYDSPANDDDYASAVLIDSSGNVVVTGTSFNGTNYDCYTAKYATNGTLLWARPYNGPLDYHDSPSAMASDAGGNVVIAGSANETDGPDTTAAYYTAKYASADGALLWEHLYEGSPDSYNSAIAVAVDASGNVAVTGYSNGGTNGDYYTARYAAADGALLWEKRYNGPGNDEDQANDVAVDAGGNVVVTGFSINTNGNSDYYTAKYAAADGALLWEQRYNSAMGGSDQANSVAVDASGNVVVTGASHNSSGNHDYYTAKYAAADGALLWEQRYNGPANGWDFAEAVAVDASGNAVVTGLSVNGTNTDFYTAKYAAANGALLWEKRYDGPGSGDDGATDVAVDGSGNVVVTGYSVGSGGNTDYYTAKYASANGALLWEKSYNGPVNGDDYASSLALGPNGIVAVTGASASDDGSSDDYATVVYWENLPPLSIARSNAFVIISWPATALNFQLQETTNLSLLNSWSPVGQSAVSNAGQISVTVPASVGSKLFRLRSP
jgi:uncharacterized delta-60 repeat protein